MLMVICVGYLSVTVCRLPITDMSICCTDDALSHLITLTHLTCLRHHTPLQPSFTTTLSLLYQSFTTLYYFLYYSNSSRPIRSISSASLPSPPLVSCTTAPPDTTFTTFSMTRFKAKVPNKSLPKSRLTKYCGAPFSCPSFLPIWGWSMAIPYRRLCPKFKMTCSRPVKGPGRSGPLCMPSISSLLATSTVCCF